ncbi:MAG: FKBP-type peptidyl-prolyl cis-trans isomerase [Proteobacteria bacterium]|nr:FKBP-type peptidyl-prolyl cis-trans isomerase [Pseudomonadota bacterium]
MKFGPAQVLPLMVALALGTAQGAEPTATPAPAGTTSTAKVDEAGSYSAGLSFANQWRDAGLLERSSVDALMRGIRAGIEGTRLTAEDRARASDFLKAAFQSFAARNQSRADEFLAHNGQVAGVKTTSSGLQYQVLASGDASGKPAGLNDNVTVKYEGRFIDGTVFDTSEGRPRPTVIRPAAVIPGWREALASMTPGARWRLFIPPSLGYGTSAPPAIPPNSLLIFDVEVVKIDAAGG